MTTPQRREGAAGEGNLFKQVWGELRRSTWPTREEAMRLTGMVVVISSAVGALLWLADKIFELLIRVVIIGS